MPVGWLRYVETLTVVHMCPPVGFGCMPCCGRTPFEVSRDRITEDRSRVTCRATARRF